MKRKLITSLLLTAAGAFASPAAVACTAAIIGASANPSGRPILWKHRDTSTTDNKVEYVAPQSDSELGYVALFNASDKTLKEAWMGMNEAGFAVMNTASYNIKDDKVAQAKMDKEGVLMTRALKTCRTVDDFARLLDTYPRPMGVEANFGVIDAYGNGAFFETNNHSYKRFNLSDEEDDVLIRTNYSHSGRKNEGYGQVRECNAETLLRPYIDEKSVTPEVLTETISRTFYRSDLHHDYTMSESVDLVDKDFIPRYKSTATIAIEGCRPIEASQTATPEFVNDEYVMWTGLGYPPVAEIHAVRCSEDGVLPGLRGTLPDGHSVIGDIAKLKRDSVFTITGKDKDPHINMLLLYNRLGTGIAQQMILRNAEYYKEHKARKSDSEENTGE